MGKQISSRFNINMISQQGIFSHSLGPSCFLNGRHCLSLFATQPAHGMQQVIPTRGLEACNLKWVDKEAIPTLQNLRHQNPTWKHGQKLCILAGCRLLVSEVSGLIFPSTALNSSTEMNVNLHLLVYWRVNASYW